MIETFTHATFIGLVDQAFVVHADGLTSVETRLTETRARGIPFGDGVRAPFSLLFHGPLRPLLPQRMYRVEHHELGLFDLFLVPVGPDGRGMRYEAVFT